jgi:hypothetical protein
MFSGIQGKFSVKKECPQECGRPRGHPRLKAALRRRIAIRRLAYLGAAGYRSKGNYAIFNTIQMNQEVGLGNGDFGLNVWNCRVYTAP